MSWVWILSVLFISCVFLGRLLTLSVYLSLYSGDNNAIYLMEELWRLSIHMEVKTMPDMQ